MTQEPLPPQSATRRSKTLGRVGIALALSITAVSLGGFWYARYFLNEKLPPLLEAQFSKTLKRPVYLGKIERVSFTGVQFGKSSIPATALDPNFLTAESLDVQVDLWSYIQERKLGLDVVIKQPQAYLKQDLTTGLYVPKLDQESTETNIIDLRTVKVEDGKLTLQPIKAIGPVTLTQLQIQSNWKITDPKQQSLKLNGNGQVVLPIIANSVAAPTPEQLLKAIQDQKADGGTLNITVDWDLTRGQGNVQLRSQNLIATAAQGFLTGLPFTPIQGRVDGTVNLQTLAGKPNPNIQGSLKIRDATLLVAAIPEPFKHVSGNVAFDGSSTTLQGITGNYGPLVLRADGTVNAQSGYNLDVALEPTDIASSLAKFGVKPGIALSGELKVSAKVTGKKPTITASFASTKPVIADRIVLNQVEGKFVTSDLVTLNFSQLKAIPALGGSLQGEGQVRIPQGKTPGSVLFAFNLGGVTAEKIATAYEAKLPIAVGLVTAAVQVYGQFNNLQVLTQFDAPNALYPIRGEVLLAGNNVATVRNTTVQFPIGAVGVSGNFNLIGDRAWQAQLTSSGIPLAALNPNSPNKLNGIVSGIANLNSPSGSFELAKINATADLNFPQGIAALPDLITARLAWDGNNLIVPNLQVSNYLTASGKVNLEFDANRIPKGIAGIDLDLRSRNVSLTRLSSFVPQLANLNSGTVNFNGRLVGALDRLNIAAGKLYVEDVKVTQLAASFAPQLPAVFTNNAGYLSFDGNVEGPISSPILNGNLKLNSETLTFNGRLVGALDRLNIVAGKLHIENVKVNQIATSLGSKLPPAFTNNASGSLTFDGNVEGPVSSPLLNGNLQLFDLKFNRIAFESRLAGPLTFDAKQGLTIDLQGNRDRIATRLDSRFQLIDFNVKLRDATAVATRIGETGDRLNVSVKDFPIPVIAPLIGQSNLDGKISSQLVVNLGANPSAIGDVIIERPRIGRIQADRLLARVNYVDGNATISNGRILISGLGDNKQTTGEYKFNLAYTPKADTQLQGNVSVASGRVQDVFTVLQWFNIQDITRGFNAPIYASAEELRGVKPIGIERRSPSYEQLEYFSQIAARIDQQETLAAARNNNLPPLSEFKGLIAGSFGFTSSKSSGLGINFDLTGKKWEYGKFAVDDVAAKGELRNEILSLNNLSLQSGDSFGRITNAKLVLNTGKRGQPAQEQSGTIELANFPIESLRPLPFFNTLPVEITGNANGTAKIGGTNYNPSATGMLTLADATINRQPLESVSGDFSYNEGRLNFKSAVRVSGPESLNVSGEIPAPTPLYYLLAVLENRYRDDLKLNIDVKNEGLAFINVLDQPVRWLDGKGNGNVIVSGTVRKPQVQGKVTLDQASFQVAGFPGDITQVNGEVNFDLDRLRSDLAGKFSDGNLTAKGVLAITDPNLIVEGKSDYENPLTIFAERLKVDIKNRYNGAVNGFLIVRGAVQFPSLGGEIALSEGRISLAGDTTSNQSDNNGNTEQPNTEQPNIAFNQLMVKLRDNTQVTRAPLLNFLAEGDIEVNGTLESIRPSGRVNITRGQVNAISARFRLDRAFDNYAVFLPSQGLNPNLNVRVVGAIPELTRTPISNTPLDAFSQNRTPVSTLGSQRTLQVQATVTGSAQNPDIELRSTPSRTQAEILALIGGGLLQQTGGDPAAALANLAGGTIITFLQDAIGDALNLSEFNLTPTTSNPVGGRASTLGFSAEAAIDITRGFSASVRTVINDPSQPTTYTLRYRINPNTLVRTSTDFQGNNSTSVEFESRF